MFKVTVHEKVVLKKQVVESAESGQQTKSSVKHGERLARSQSAASATNAGDEFDRLLSKVTHRYRDSDPLHERVRLLKHRAAKLFENRNMSCFGDEPADYLNEARKKIEELRKEADELLAGLSPRGKDYSSYEYSEYNEPRPVTPEIKMKVEKLFADLFRVNDLDYPDSIKYARPQSGINQVDHITVSQSRTSVSSFSSKNGKNQSSPNGDNPNKVCKCKCTCSANKGNLNSHLSNGRDKVVYRKTQSCKCFHTSDCQYTCHHHCRQHVTLDCSHAPGDGGGGDSPAKTPEDKEPLFQDGTLTDTVSQVDDTDSGYHTEGSTLLSSMPSERTLSREDLKKRIHTFNEAAQGLHMTLDTSGDTFQGFIRVNMNLMRPINMSIGTRPPSIYEVLTMGGTAERENTKTTSFYLPRDTIKALHIHSVTTNQDVITTLLNKFQITDNPRKFALYEQTIGDDKKVMMRKIQDHEHPLVLCMTWANVLHKKRFILQENDTGEIVWEAFSSPELKNFLKILDREEAEYIEQVRAKYHLLRFHMDQRMKELKMEAEKQRKQQQGSERQPVFV